MVSWHNSVFSCGGAGGVEFYVILDSWAFLVLKSYKSSWHSGNSCRVATLKIYINLFYTIYFVSYVLRNHQAEFEINRTISTKDNNKAIGYKRTDP